MNDKNHIAIMGGGPAGLMAAEAIASSKTGIEVHVFDAMPSVGRKFLLAGRGGLNLTHAEAFEQFTTRYPKRQAEVLPLLQAFTPQNLRDWAAGLGIETFVGSSQRVFPTDMKAAPLLRAWLARLRASGVQFHARSQLLGIEKAGSGVALSLQTPTGLQRIKPHATVLALGGASWQRLGSNGAWVPWLTQHGVQIAPLVPSNCGFDVETPWSEHLKTKFAGQPLKPVALRFGEFQRQGEFVITETGIEGSLVYAASSALREHIAGHGAATLELDLLPAHSLEHVAREVGHPRGSRSWSNHLKSRLNLAGLKVALLHELLTPAQWQNPQALAQAIKALPLSVARTRPIDEAISTAGGVAFDAMTPQLMLNALPSVFCAGEMLDWEAPTGGYLLQACMASGLVAGRGAVSWLAGQSACAIDARDASN